MNVLLVNYPFNIKKYYLDEQYTPEHLGLEYLATILRTSEFNVRIIDGVSIPVSEDEVLKECLSPKYKLIGFTTYQSTFQDTLRITKIIKNKQDNAHLTLGGTHVSFNPKEVLKRFSSIDSVIFGEGELPLLDLAKALRNNSLGSKDIPGVVYREKDQIILSEKGFYIDNLDDLPYPARDILENRLKKGSFLSTRIQGSRGCLGSCLFCPVKPFGELHKNFINRRTRTPENVIDEIKYLNNKYGIKDFSFVDSDFLGFTQKDISRISEFADRLEKENLEIQLRISARADSVLKQKENLKNLKNLGLIVVFVGFEFGNEEDLALFNKQISLEENREAAYFLASIKLPVEVGFIMFHPFITFEKLRKNAKFLLDIKKAHLFWHFVYDMEVHPGTPQVKMLENSHLLKMDPLDSTECYEFKEEKIKNLHSYLSTVAAKMRGIDRELWNKELIHKGISEEVKNKIGKKNFNFFLRALDYYFLKTDRMSVNEHLRDVEDIIGSKSEIILVNEEDI